MIADEDCSKSRNSDLDSNPFAPFPLVEGDCLIGLISIGDVVNNIIHRQRRTISKLESKAKPPKEEPFEPVVPRFPSTPKTK